MSATSDMSAPGTVAIALDRIEAYARALLHAMGASATIAADVAEHLVKADRSGYASHGVSILPSYHQAILGGQLQAGASARLLLDSGIFQSWDGEHGFGQHIGRQVFLRAADAAARYGQCIVTVRHSHHLGRMGHYAEMMAARGQILLAFSNVMNREPMVAPFGGAEARLTTNPLAFGLPMPSGLAPLVVDIATSAVALNRTRVWAENGQPAPPGSLIDAEGRPSTDPKVIFAQPPGALLPFGGHKGYALGVMTEILAGVFSGGGTVQPEHPRGGLATNNLFALVFDPGHPSHGGNADWQARETQAFTDYLLSCPAQPGGSGVQYPGQFEAQAQARHADAIELGTGSWNSLLALGRELQIAPPDTLTPAA